MFDYSFIKSQHNVDQLSQSGFFTASFLDAEQRSALAKLFQKTFDQDGLPPVFMSAAYPELSARQAAHHGILEICQPSLERLFVDYKAVIGLFFVKQGKVEEILHVHQDPCFVDQSEFIQLGLWAPLQDAKKENGGMFVIPGSHLFFTPFQSRSFPSPWTGVTDSLIYHQIEPVNLAAGEALIMDNRLLHGSYPNNSNATRMAMVIKLSHPESKVIDLYHKQGTPAFSIYEQPDDYMISDQWNPLDEDAALSGTLVKSYAYEAPDTDDNRFRQMLNGEAGYNYDALQPLADEPVQIAAAKLESPPIEQPGDKPSGIFQWLKKVFSN